MTMICTYKKTAGNGVISANARLNISAVGGQTMSAQAIARGDAIPQPQVQCRVCDEVKEKAEFYPKQVRKDGAVGECKECTKRRVRHRARTNPAVQEYDRARSKRPQKAASIRRVSDAWNAKNPEAYKAHNAVSNAVRDKRLFKEPCIFCGQEKVHAHHRDYSKPLDVIWLCPKCHHRLHANFPETAAHEVKL